ncbi:hypothetical protein ACIBSW_34465 [Actinoplanes sp. NPDC049668]|uniref:hypothetical protein n=1 Tax=unclassified Actinoplanes TaxID=2626549 RepID=UPI0033B68D03
MHYDITDPVTLRAELAAFRARLDDLAAELADPTVSDEDLELWSVKLDGIRAEIGVLRNQLKGADQ